MQTKLLKPVFIIGLHRTGSTFLKNILNNNSKIAMATDEMDLSNPWRTTFENQFARLKKMQKNDFPSRVVETIYNDDIQGTFWKDYRELNISKETVKQKFESSDGTLKDLISILLDEYRKLENKQRAGVKYPLHFSRTHILKQWFPDARILFLYRDARAVCASKVNDEATRIRKKRAGPLSFLVHYGTWGVFIFEYIWSSYFFIKNREALNIHAVCYERLLLEPEKEIKQICDFCDIPFEKEMLTATGKPSSHTGKITSRLDRKRLSAWKNRINPFDIFLISLLTKKSMKKLGYELEGLDIKC